VATATKDKQAETAPANGVTNGQIDIDGKTVKAPEPPVEEVRVHGTAQLTMFDVGGKRATTSSVRLSGGSVKLVDGQAYKKGDVIHFEGTAVVNEVGQKDEHDPKTGIVVSATQRHGARITDLTIRGAE
jgi:hypothetical protein